jgi:hypothetical protein
MRIVNPQLSVGKHDGLQLFLRFDRILNCQEVCVCKAARPPGVTVYRYPHIVQAFQASENPIKLGVCRLVWDVANE